MFKRSLGILIGSVLWIAGCGDNQTLTGPETRTASTFTPTYTPSHTPTPARTPIPPAILPPVVTSAHTYDTDAWEVNGAHFEPDPIVTFESAVSAIALHFVSVETGGRSVRATVPKGQAPGAYTPCVTTVNGKDCGGFLVTVK